MKKYIFLLLAALFISLNSDASNVLDKKPKHPKGFNYASHKKTGHKLQNSANKKMKTAGGDTKKFKCNHTKKQKAKKGKKH